MKTITTLIILSFFISALPINLLAQEQKKTKSGYELGIDFARFNRNWNYIRGQYPNNGLEYVFDFIPSPFVTLIKEKFSIRFKYEFLAKNYSSHSMSFDVFEFLEGRLKETEHFLELNVTLLIKKSKFIIFQTLGFLFQILMVYIHTLILLVVHLHLNTLK